MRTVATILRRTALGVTALFAVGGLLFALGYAFEDLELWSAVLVTAALVLPLVALVVLALRRPETALRVVTAAVVLFGAYVALDVVVELFEAPEVPLIGLVLSVPIAILGQRRALRAGELLLVLAALPFVQVLVRLLTEAAVDRPGLGALLGGSTGAVVVPLALFAGLFLAAAAFDDRGVKPVRRPAQPPARAARQH